MGLILFFSYSRRDSELYDIPLVAEKLENFPDIDKVLYYEDEDYSNIIKYMEENIGKCDAFLYFCSENAFKSQYIQIEWHAALSAQKTIIPVFKDLKYVPNLLKPLRGVKYDEADLKKSVLEIHEIILKAIVPEDYDYIEDKTKLEEIESEEEELKRLQEELQRKQKQLEIKKKEIERKEKEKALERKEQELERREQEIKKILERERKQIESAKIKRKPAPKKKDEFKSDDYKPKVSRTYSGGIVGLVIMRWDDRIGIEICAKYPEDIVVMDKTLMQIYSTHEYSGEAGMISLMVGPLNIASYYAGPETSLYAFIILTLDNDPDAYEGGLSDLMRTIVQNLDDNAYISMIPSLFQRLAIYPTLNEEQQFAVTYQDEIKRLVISRLRDEGVITKSELAIWLKDKFRGGFIDLDAIINDLIRQEFIKETSIKGMPSELIFLINDLIMLRIPPINLLKNPSETGLPDKIVPNFISECKKFFHNYQPSENDNLQVIEVLLNPAVYETLRLLRIAIVTRTDLEKLKKKGVEDIDYVLKILWELKIIQVFQDDKRNEYYALLSDFYIEQYFPEYILNLIIMEYNTRSKADKVLIEYLWVLLNSLEKEKGLFKRQVKKTYRIIKSGKSITIYSKILTKEQYQLAVLKGWYEEAGFDTTNLLGLNY